MSAVVVRIPPPDTAQSLREQARDSARVAVDHLLRGDRDGWSLHRKDADILDAAASAAQRREDAIAAQLEQRCRGVAAIDGILEIAHRRQTAEALARVLEMADVPLEAG